jgi:hypothetical protein
MNRTLDVKGVVSSRPFSSTQHPGDHPGPELAVLHGISASAIAADGTKTIRYSSRVVDLCRTLAASSN